MSETIEPNIAGAPAAPAFKLSLEDTVKQLHTYADQAEKSLAQLQSNIDNYLKQIDEWRRIQLMIAGQKQLLADLISKTVVTPTPVTLPESKSANSETN